MDKKASVVGVFIAALVATGCSSKEAPNCSDSATKNLVIQIASNELAHTLNTHKELFESLAEMFGGQLDHDVTSIEYSIEAIRVSGKNDETGSYSCKANLVTKANDTSSQVPIAYTSELVNEGDGYYVEVYGLDQEAIGELLSVLITL